MGRGARGQIADLLEGSEADSRAGSEASFEACSSHFGPRGMRCGGTWAWLTAALARSPVWPLGSSTCNGEGNWSQS